MQHSALRALVGNTRHYPPLKQCCPLACLANFEELILLFAQTKYSGQLIALPSPSRYSASNYSYKRNPHNCFPGRTSTDSLPSSNSL